MVCAFTGHRAMKWPIDGELFERSLVNLIENFEIDTFLDGMAMGFDLFAARKVIELKKKYRIELVACIPYGDQISSMKGDDRQLYEYVLENCDDVRIISAEYYPGCLYARNRYMVDNADEAPVLVQFANDGRETVDGHDVCQLAYPLLNAFGIRPEELD